MSRPINNLWEIDHKAYCTNDIEFKTAKSEANHSQHTESRTNLILINEDWTGQYAQEPIKLDKVSRHGSLRDRGYPNYRPNKI